MGLNSSEHHRLATIAEHLTRDDPALAALLAGFTGPPLWRRVVGHGLMPVLLFVIAPLLLAVGLAAGIPALLICGCALTIFTPFLAVLWSTRFWSGRPAFG
jgi:hypothetical protein